MTGLYMTMGTALTYIPHTTTRCTTGVISPLHGILSAGIAGTAGMVGTTRHIGAGIIRTTGTITVIAMTTITVTTTILLCIIVITTGARHAVTAVISPQTVLSVAEDMIEVVVTMATRWHLPAEVAVTITAVG